MTDCKIEIKQALDKLMAHVEQFHLIYSGTQPEFEKLVANLMGKTAEQPAPARQPLTHTEIVRAWDAAMTGWIDTKQNPYTHFARAIEAAHNITTPESKK